MVGTVAFSVLAKLPGVASRCERAPVCPHALVCLSFVYTVDPRLERAVVLGRAMAPKKKKAPKGEAEKAPEDNVRGRSRLYFRVQ